MPGTPEIRRPSEPRMGTALRACVLLALGTMMTGCGGGGSAPEASPTRPPQVAGAATLFPGEETGQDSDAQVNFPRADPGESTEVEVTVANTTSEPMDVEAVEVTGEGTSAGASISRNECDRPVPPGESCKFRMLIPAGAADKGIQIELRTDRGDVTADVSPREPGPDTTSPGEDTWTSEPDSPTSRPPDGDGTTGPDPDPDTAPDPDPDTAPEPDPDTAPEEVPPVIPS